MHNRLHLVGRNHPATVRCHHHRGLDALTVTHKSTLFGLREVHPGTLDGANLGNTLGQLLLYGCGITRLLHKLTGGHRRLIFERVENAPPLRLRDPLRGKQNTRLMITPGRHGKLAARRINTRIKIGRLERIECTLLVGFVHAGKHHAVRGLLHPEIKCGKGKQDRQHDNRRHGFSYRRLLQHPAQGREHGNRTRLRQSKAGAGRGGCARRGGNHASGWRSVANNSWRKPGCKSSHSQSILMWFASVIFKSACS